MFVILFFKIYTPYSGLNVKIIVEYQSGQKKNALFSKNLLRVALFSMVN